MELLDKDCLDKLNVPVEDVVFGYVDPSTSTTGETEPPMGFRPSRLRRIAADQPSTMEPPVGGGDVDDTDHKNSLVLQVTVPLKQEYQYGSDDDDTSDEFKVVGWELNARGKPGPRWVNLRPLLDSRHLSIQAADLNLKLMKWRMIPDLNVHKLQSTKVLLIGAGTLGCSVARTLVGWGIRNFTIVDYGN
eukprot:scaffold106227_cov30-Attheya_sp.AAC.2